MKKIISIIAAALFICSCFALTVSADAAYTFSEDYKTVYYEGNIYHSFNANGITSDCYGVDGFVPNLSEEQAKEVLSASVSVADGKAMLQSEIMFVDGRTLITRYIRSDYYPEYKRYIENGNQSCYVELGLFETEKVLEFETSRLKGSEIEMTLNEYYAAPSVSTYFNIADGELCYYTGEIVVNGDEYYYIDFKDAGIYEPYFYNWPESFKAYAIEDPDTLSLLAENADAIEGNTEAFVSGMADLNDVITSALLILLFAVIPGAVFIFTFIMTIVSKKSPYKRLYAKVTLVSAVEMALFAVIVLLVTLSRII